MSPLEQMRVVCYRDAYREASPGVVENLHARIAPKVQKIGGGSPTRNAIRQLLEQVDADPAWYPGKAAVLAHAGKRSGPEPALSGAKKRCIANSAMAAKEEGLEPTYPLAVARCPKAVLNPATNEPVDKKIVYSIFKTMCYDKDPTQKWKNQARAARGALTLAMMAHRLAWGRQMLALGHAAGYFFRHYIWVDFCSTVLPRTAKKTAAQALARKGKKGWVSNDAKGFSRNLQGGKESLKQNSWDSVKVFWAPVLVRGKLHIVALPGVSKEGAPAAAALAEKLPGVLRHRFPEASLPRVVMSDRGPGFFHGPTGNILAAWKDGLRAGGLRAAQGDNAMDQAGYIGDCLLHETAVAWVRYRETVTLPAQPWKESEEAFYTRLRGICEHVNQNHAVEDLCLEFPERMRALVEKKGDKLQK